MNRDIYVTRKIVTRVPVAFKPPPIGERGFLPFPNDNSEWCEYYPSTIDISHLSEEEIIDLASRVLIVQLQSLIRRGEVKPDENGFIEWKPSHTKKLEKEK